MSKISTLLARLGDVESNRHLNRGNALAATISGLAGIPSAMRRDRLEDEDRAAVGRVRDAQLETERLQQRNYQGQMDARDNAQMDEAGARDLAKTTEAVVTFFTDVESAPDLPTKQALWEEGRTRLLAEGRYLSQKDLPAVYPGPSFIKPRLAKVLLPAGEQFKQMFPEVAPPKTREIKVRNGDGSESIRIVEDTPGQDFSSAPPPEEEVEVTVPGPNGPIRKLVKRSQLREGVAEYRAPNQAPLGETFTLVSPTGEQRVVQGVQSVNELLGQGWQKYDAVASRQSTAPTEDARYITEQALQQARRLYDPKTGAAHPGIDAATGAWEMRGNWDQNAVNFNSIRTQLVNALALPNLGALRGPMSDRDVLFVKNISTRLENPRLSRDETERAVSEAIQFLESKLASAPAGPAAPVAPPAPAANTGRAAAAGPVGRSNPFRR